MVLQIGSFLWTSLPTTLYFLRKCTSERPDIIIWSASLKKVFLVELTCPAEEGIEAAAVRKEARYKALCQHVNDSDWSCRLLTIEVGARGFVAYSFQRFLRSIGLAGRQVSAVCKTIALVAARCSFAIYLARASKHWDAKRALLIV